MKIPIPREHGAWAMIYSPFLTAILVADHFHPRVLLLLIALTAIFFAHEPILILARTKPDSSGADTRRKNALRWAVTYLLAAAVASAPLLFYYRLWLLLPLGALMCAMLTLHYHLLSRKEERSIPSEILAICSLTASAPVACYVLSGALDSRAALLWTLNALYFTSSIFYVKVLVSRFSRKSNPKTIIIESVVYHTVLLLVLSLLFFVQWVPALAIIAFVPAILRAGWSLFAKDFRLNLRRIGFAEFGFTTLFVILVSTALRG